MTFNRTAFCWITAAISLIPTGGELPAQDPVSRDSFTARSRTGRPDDEPNSSQEPEHSGAEADNWRKRRWPRIGLPPDPRLMTFLLEPSGWTSITGAATDARARTVRVVNLRTADQVIAPVHPDGAFEVRVFAPPGSSLQINTSMLLLADLPPHLQDAVSRDGTIRLWELEPGRTEQLGSVIASHHSSSPAIILPVVAPHRSERAGSEFVTKVGPKAWCFGSAALAPSCARPGDQVRLSLELSLAVDGEGTGAQWPNGPPGIHAALHPMFDGHGRQCAHMRLSASHLLTPTGLPIETHNEMAREGGPAGGHWHPIGSGCPIPCQVETSQPWRHAEGVATTQQTLLLEIPEQLPSGWYGVSAHITGLGQDGYEIGEFDGGPWYLGCLQVGHPEPPRLACMLLGSSGPGGTRGTVAREDRDHYALNPRNRPQPEKLVIPRDDVFNSEPILYPLDPYLPLVSRTDRPAPVLRSPRIRFDFAKSRLTVRVTAPDGTIRTLGPAPLVAGQHDLSVLRPDQVVRNRVLPPIAPTYGNPSLGDIYHLTGRGAFDHAFRQYGHHVIELEGEICDLEGIAYQIAGTYDVYVAQPLDVDVFPEPGTPLYPGVEITPQVSLQPAMAADVEIHWRYYPHSNVRRMVETTIRGQANRFGIFVSDSSETQLVFQEPGEYVCDVTAQYWDRHGTLWMASRRGASVVVTPDSDIIVHGERGNRSPTARWRARWFLAGDNRFVAPPEVLERPPEQIPSVFAIDLGHTCYPYESGDTAWLGHRGSFSLFPNITFEDPRGIIARLIGQRWPGVRRGAGREGLYPYRLLPEDRQAIGEMPYVCMTFTGLPPSISPNDVDQWGYFYTTSWRPGVSVRSQVSEDMVPAGYWFFDDPYGWQCGVGPQGDLAGDVKINYGGAVFRDLFTGTTNYGAYASMVVLTNDNDPRGARVLPPFDGLLPGSPRSGPLLDIGGKRYDVFLTFGAVRPGAILEVGDQLRVAGVVWPPVSGHVEGTIVAPSGKKFPLRSPSNAMGMFDAGGPTVHEPGVWQVHIEGVCSGKTSAGNIAELVPPERWPRGSGIGLVAATFEIPVVSAGVAPICFDIPPGSRASPPAPLVIRGHLPKDLSQSHVQVIASLPGQVIDRQSLPIHGGTFQYVYDPERLRRAFPNIDTRIEVPFPRLENAAAWFDTVTFTFWSGQDVGTVAGTVLLQGEQICAEASSGRPLPAVAQASAGPDWLRSGISREVDHGPLQPEPDVRARAGRPLPGRGTESGPHSSLLQLFTTGHSLVAAHPWSGEVVRCQVGDSGLHVVSKVAAGGEPRSLALSPDGKSLFVALANASRILALDAESLAPLTLHDVEAEPRAVLCTADGTGLIVADFRGDRLLRLNTTTGRLEATSDCVNRPAALALSPARGEVYTVSFRSGEFVVLDEHCRILRRLPPPAQLGQCQHLTIGADGLVYAPQTRADTALGGQMFDRSVFPVVSVAELELGQVSLPYSPDLLVVPPHRPVEVAVDENVIYLACAGSDDVLAIDRRTGFARWHATKVGLEPAGIALDAAAGRLYVLTVTGQSIVTLETATGRVLHRLRFTEDPTPPAIARGRYLFGTATDPRLTKEQWMSCAVCHPDGTTDGLQWNFGDGPLDTRALGGCLRAPPLHLDAHLDEIQDTYDFARTVMAGRWFLRREDMHEWLGKSNAGLDRDLDALAAYIASLQPDRSPPPPDDLISVIERGREVFFREQTGCAHCHPPPLYTDSGKRDESGGFVMHDVGTGVSVEGQPNRCLDTPSLLGLARSEPYLHDGRARTLEEVLTKCNAADKHGRTSQLSMDEVRALAAFLRHLAPP